MFRDSWLNPARARRRIAHQLSSSLAALPVPGTGSDFRRFVIFTTGRSGSNLLIQRCESHPNIACYGEVFNGNGIQWYRTAGPESRALHDFRDNDPSAFLTKHVWHRFPNKIAAVGFKLLHAQYFPNAEKIKSALLSVPDLQIIFLRRENALRVFLAAERAKVTRVHGIMSAKERPVVPPITLSPEKCLEHIRMTIASETALRHTFSGSPVLDLTYENLVNHGAAENRRVCDFLGVDNRPLTNRSVRLAPAPLRDQIANYDDLRTFFEGSEWIRFLDDDA